MKENYAIDPLKILDDMEEIRQKAAEHPKDYPVDFTIRVLCGIVAEAFGYETRLDWTEILRETPESKYHQRYYGEPGKFHP